MLPVESLKVGNSFRHPDFRSLEKVRIVEIDQDRKVVKWKAQNGLNGEIPFGIMVEFLA